jgi:hypothetical protein
MPPARHAYEIVTYAWPGGRAVRAVRPDSAGDIRLVEEAEVRIIVDGGKRPSLPA